MANRTRNKKQRTFSNDFDNDISSYEYYTIQTINKTPRNNHFSSHQSTSSNYFTNTITNTFLKKKPKLNVKLISNYHKHYLRERIKSNIQFQHLYLTERNIPSKKIASPFSTLYSKSTQTNTLISPYQEKKTSMFYLNSKSKYDNKNLEIKNKRFNKSQRSFFPSVRTEKLFEFKDKINNEIKGKYILYQKKDFCDKLEKKLQDKIEQYKQNIRKFETTGKLYYSYLKTYDNYEKHLDNVLNREIDINENYKESIYQLKNDIARIKIKITKLKVQLKENFENKCFLMCVKNSTRLVDKFSPEDLEELKLDNLLLSYHLNENPINENLKKRNVQNITRKNTLPRRNSSIHHVKSFNRTATVLSYITSPKKIVPERKLSISSMERLANTYRKKHINKKLFNDPQDFVDHLGSIRNSISNSLMIYNNIRDEINVKKHELASIENDINMKNYLKSLKNDIEIAEKKLIEYKNRNEDMKKVFENLQIENKKASNTLNKVQQRIYNMYNNICSFLKINKDISQMTDLQILNLFEKSLNTFLMKQNEDKINYPNEYMKILKEIDKKKKIEQTKNLIIKQKNDLNKKINKVIEKSQKIIIKQNRKTEKNIYLIDLHSKKKIKKPVKQENPYELLEY